MPADVAAVAIGRNEGSRLVACLESLVVNVANVVYVDSGSTDNSVANASRLGAEVVSLDTAKPFTAARARNVGILRLIESGSSHRYIMMVDGDCAVHSGWLDTAHAFLEANPKVGGVCGRRRERHPEMSIYNQLCDWEWDTPAGETGYCGGDVLFRVSALRQSGMYDETLVAGEDEEICLRIRRAGWILWRLDEEMTLHDANIRSFAQWWKRMVRAGHAFAQVGSKYPIYGASQRRRMWTWTVVLPIAVVFGFILAPWAGALTLSIFVASVLRGTRKFMKWGMRPAAAFCSGVLLMLSKLANLQGYVLFQSRKALERVPTIIEYK